MKSNMRGRFYTDEELKAVLREGVNEHFNIISTDILTQVISVVLVTLDKDYGWKEKRLREFLSSLESQAVLLRLGECLGKSVQIEDMISYLHSTYNLNMKEEVKKLM